MPIYEFQHILPLARVHRATLARLITDWHATTFMAPRFIVNCRFINLSTAKNEDNWVGGQALTTNRLSITLRGGTSRTSQQYEAITRKIVSIWDEVVKEIPAETSSTKELKDVFIMGAIDSAFERGFFLPMPGHFEEWVIKNKSLFQKQADEGDETSQRLLEEIQERPEFQSSKTMD